MQSEATTNIVELYRERTPGSCDLFERSQDFLPGGDSRSTIHYSPYPLYFESGEGCWLFDVDGNRYLDFSNNHTALVLGNRHPSINAALQPQLERGTCFPGPSEPQYRLAKMICERTASIERVRFTNSGSEATMNALRAARAFTGRQKIAKAEGAYHGSSDGVSFNISQDPQGNGSSARAHVDGLPSGVDTQVVVFPFNDVEGSRRVLEKNGKEIAAVFIEPVMANAGMIAARGDFLQFLRDITQELGCLLVFDEVVTYRLARGGAQEYFGIRPDLTCLGKMIGGGLPLGAFGGREDIMSLFDPTQGRPRIPHAGSLNANPMSLAAGAATLETLTDDVYDRLNLNGEILRQSLQGELNERNVAASVTGLGSLFGVHFSSSPVVDYRSAWGGDAGFRHQLFLGMLNEGIVMDPRGAGCLSSPMTEDEVTRFVTTMIGVLERLNNPNP